MTDLKNQIQQLIVQGENLIHSIPKKSDYKSREMNIRDRYRLNEPADSFGREILSQGAGELVSSLFGTRTRVGKSMASKALRNQTIMQRDNEIRQLYQQFDIHYRESEQRYNNWSSEAVQAIKLSKCFYCLKKFTDSKQKVKLETRLRGGIVALNQALNYLEKSPQKETLLIKTGEPLKGRRVLKEFLGKAKAYVKIQEPYPTHEILETLEDATTNIKCQLLLGPFNNMEAKEKFEKNLALLRKAGRNIEVVSIKCGKTAPFHDRFLISEKKGISTGTSLSGLGMRDSIITGLNEWKDIEKRFDGYMIGPKTQHRGKDCKRERL